MAMLSKRLERLEAAGGNECSPIVKQWLSLPLTDSEMAELKNYRAPDIGEFDTNNWSPELRVWLGLEVSKCVD